jgi:hypothetical protein
VQATAAVKHTQRNHVRIAAIIVILLGVLGTGAAVAAITRNGDAPSDANVSALAGPNTNANFRFAEMNMLPEAAAARPMTYQQYRLREMNALPEAAPAPIVIFNRWHFLEINALPGDDAHMVAPFSDQRSESY